MQTACKNQSETPNRRKERANQKSFEAKLFMTRLNLYLNLRGQKTLQSKRNNL